METIEPGLKLCPPKHGACEANGSGRSCASKIIAGCLVCFLASSLVEACNVPVFRYALERWPSAPYDCTLVSHGALTDRDQELVARLSGKGTNSFANINMRLIDSHTNEIKTIPKAGEIYPSRGGLSVILRYPEGTPIPGVIWTGQLSESNVVQLLDSPVRRRITQRLLRGDSAVWVLLESGDPALDNAAAQLLQTRIDHCQKTLTLPKPDISNDDNSSASLDAASLKPVFSMLRLAYTAHKN